MAVISSSPLRVLFLLAILALAALMVGLGRPRLAVACSLGPPPAMKDQVRSADLIFVGQVVRERRIEFRGSEGYASTLHVAAVLKGRPPLEVTISPLGFNHPDCSGGPRLPVGQRMLIFLPEEYQEQSSFLRSIDRFGPDDPIEDRLEDRLVEIASFAHTPDENLHAAVAFARGGPLPHASDSNAMPALAAGAAVAAIALFLLVLFRSRGSFRR